MGDWDYIVVGAGSAGCAVAGGLAQAGLKVVLVEAGPRGLPFRQPFETVGPWRCNVSIALLGVFPSQKKTARSHDLIGSGSLKVMRTC